MTAKHQTPEYRRNAKTRRQQVKAAHKFGQPVPCWRCGRPIFPGQPFDVGHIDGALGSTLRELAPEHRGENRRAGGAVGAARREARRLPDRGEVMTWKL